MARRNKELEEPKEIAKQVAEPQTEEVVNLDEMLSENETYRSGFQAVLHARLQARGKK